MWNEKSVWVSVLSQRTILKAWECFESLGFGEQAILWGSWARYYATENPLIARHDVDILVSEFVCRRYYEMALTLRNRGFYPVDRIADLKLDEVLKSSGFPSVSIFTDKGDGRGWGLLPWLKNRRIRKYVSGCNLDLIFDPIDFASLPGSETWVLRGGNQSQLIRDIDDWADSEILFHSPLKTSIGFLVPSRKAQVRFNEILMNRIQERDMDEAKIAKIRRAINQLEHSHWTDKSADFR